MLLRLIKLPFRIMRHPLRYPPLSYMMLALSRSKYLLRRFSIGWSYAREPLYEFLKWSLKQSESDNFYYGLTDLNKDHLAWLIGHVTALPTKKAREYIDELENDEEFRRDLQQKLTSHPGCRDIKVEFGRRVGWYAFLRALKPRVVVETGVHHGIGACVLCRALQRNAEEGCPGRYFGTELLEQYGFLLTEPYDKYGEIIYGDSLETLRKFSQEIDIFINDSDHDAGYEYEEYVTVSDKLSRNAIIIGDNAHASSSLAKFAEEKGRSFLFWAEKPVNHFYPGAGIGLCFTPNSLVSRE